MRDAGPDDGAACAAVYAPYVTDTAVTFETEPPTAAQMTERIAAAHVWLVLDDRGERLPGARAHGQGRGRALYEPLLARLAARGFRTAVAGLTLPNDASVALHRALGFDNVGTYRRVGWKHGSWHDVAWVQRPLVEGDAPPTPLR